MEDSTSDINSTGSPASGRHNNNLAQRFSRQLSRTILPALRNLVRSNRPQQRGRGSVSELSAPTPPLPNSPILSSPRPTENINPPQSPPTDPLACITAPGSPQQEDDTPPLIESPSEPTSPSSFANGLRIINNLGDLANLDNNTTNASSTTSEDMDTSPTNNRQRYRLVVYFEERSQEEHPTARYVAVIVGRLDELQFLLSSSNTTERGFGDILNNLFNAYAPKGTPPAAKDIIDSLPTVTITEQEQSCMICLENFAEGSSAVVLPCKHMFHGEECVKSWLKLHNSCPICRYELPVEDPEYESQRKERMVARGFQEEEHSHTHDHEGDVDMSTSESDNNVGWLFGDDEPHSV